MSAAKMVADSTQAEPADTADGKKRKKKLKKTGKKVSLPEDEDSDLDLKKELQPISAFVKSRASMVEEMFHAVRGASLQRALPDLLKSVPLEELKQLCLEQLEVMSKKRIRRILAGEESANISSSGTEDDTTDEETEPAENACVDRSAASNSGGEDKEEVKAEVEAQPADSTSVHQESLSKPEEAPSHGGFVASFEQVEVKQEPPDSAEEDMEEGGEEADDGEEEEEDEEK
ncbi:caspase activity and apoptosis inhibitor 1 [Aplysia californica]|uniref:Caspase activity and apoptosis inhibitor 1 n=1 Tax=Aplysia californica TaxID=6500 RepID=A0ABM1AEL7_APLCA|nr:caspase activity and apoptosis inhibitor 1 [Aplysia californica]